MDINMDFVCLNARKVHRASGVDWDAMKWLHFHVGMNELSDMKLV